MRGEDGRGSVIWRRPSTEIFDKEFIETPAHGKAPRAGVAAG